MLMIRMMVMMGRRKVVEVVERKMVVVRLTTNPIPPLLAPQILKTPLIQMIIIHHNKTLTPTKIIQMIQIKIKQKNKMIRKQIIKIKIM